MSGWRHPKKKANDSSRNIANNINFSACSHDLVVECILYP
nr:MAG TPA: hypothetical protein [Caudoviricetes sp.]